MSHDLLRCGKRKRILQYRPLLLQSTDGFRGTPLYTACRYVQSMLGFGFARLVDGSSSFDNYIIMMSQSVFSPSV